MFDPKQIKQWIQAAEREGYACPQQTCLIRGCLNEQNIAHQTREKKNKRNVLSCLIECLMAFKFYHTRSNTTKHTQTRSNSTKQGGQTIKCLVTKQCLMVFGRQTFLVWSGRYGFCFKIYHRPLQEGVTAPAHPAPPLPRSPSLYNAKNHRDNKSIDSFFIINNKSTDVENFNLCKLSSSTLSCQIVNFLTNENLLTFLSNLTKIEESYRQCSRHFQ